MMLFGTRNRIGSLSYSQKNRKAYPWPILRKFLRTSHSGLGYVGLGENGKKGKANTVGTVLWVLGIWNGSYMNMKSPLPQVNYYGYGQVGRDEGEDQ